MAVAATVMTAKPKRWLNTRPVLARALKTAAKVRRAVGDVGGAGLGEPAQARIEQHQHQNAAAEQASIGEPQRTWLAISLTAPCSRRASPASARHTACRVGRRRRPAARGAGPGPPESKRQQAPPVSVAIWRNARTAAGSSPSWNRNARTPQQAQLAGEPAQLVDVLLHRVADEDEGLHPLALGLAGGVAQDPGDLGPAGDAAHARIRRTSSDGWPTQRLARHSPKPR